MASPIYAIELPKNTIDHENYYDRNHEEYFNATDICKDGKRCNRVHSLDQCCIYKRDVKLFNESIAICVISGYLAIIILATFVPYCINKIVKRMLKKKNENQ